NSARPDDLSSPVIPVGGRHNEPTAGHETVDTRLQELRRKINDPSLPEGDMVTTINQVAELIRTLEDGNRALNSAVFQVISESKFIVSALKSKREDGIKGIEACEAAELAKHLTRGPAFVINNTQTGYMRYLIREMETTDFRVAFQLKHVVDYISYMPVETQRRMKVELEAAYIKISDRVDRWVEGDKKDAERKQLTRWAMLNSLVKDPSDTCENSARPDDLSSPVIPVGGRHNEPTAGHETVDTRLQELRRKINDPSLPEGDMVTTINQVAELIRTLEDGNWALNSAIFRVLSESKFIVSALKSKREDAIKGIEACEAAALAKSLDRGPVFEINSARTKYMRESIREMETTDSRVTFQLKGVVDYISYIPLETQRRMKVELEAAYTKISDRVSRWVEDNKKDAERKQLTRWAMLNSLPHFNANDLEADLGSVSRDPYAM
ncbi:hypothetical protein H0H93_012723, partial [Arthromyces matolae]